MKLFMFHLMPYADINQAEAAKYPSVWVKFPNSNFDPVKGHALYNRYLDELELAAELGMDGVAVNEHHQNAYGIMPSPVVTASALSRRVKTAKIAILGSGFGLRENPLTLAEEHAMIDCITGGRLISGFVRGIGAEYHSMGVNPVTSLERHMEAHDLVVRAWTEPGPFEFTGNRERMGDLLLETDAQVVQLLSSDRRVVVIVQENTLKRFQNLTTGMPLQLLGKSGVWQLYANH